ncbi:MAG: phenylacetate--CoA ligase family protein, partial [Candidatus Hodarchaeota archaeon]
IIKKASKSALYSDKWKKYNLKAGSLAGFEGLSKIPYTSADDLRKVWEEKPIDEIILTKNVGIWHCTSGSMGTKKWMPWTYADYTMSQKEIGKMLLEGGLRPDDIVMAIVLPAPFISGALPYRILESTGSIGSPVEQIVMSPDYVEDGFPLLLKRQPTVFLCTPMLALRMAEEIAKNTPRILARLAKEKKSMKLKFASFITKIKSIKPKRVFKRLRNGYFTTEALAPYRKAVEQQYDLEAFDIYGFTEGYGGAFECQEHDGLHFPSLHVILEIIPQNELEKENRDPEYIPESVLLSEAREGLIGELVATDFKEALPLVRYRVRDLVKVVSVDGCACGRFYPRMDVLGRTDDVINLGVIRLSSLVINSLLSSDFKSGRIGKWEIFISRQGYKPKLRLRIEPEEAKEEEKFKQEIFEKLYSFDIFKTGFDTGLFVFDDIQFISKLKLEIVGQGKARRIRYDPNYSKAVKF